MSELANFARIQIPNFTMSKLNYVNTWYANDDSKNVKFMA